MIVRLQRPLALHPCPRAIARPLQTCRVLQAKNLPPRPKVDEAEITENFLKGSGPGGQKINKTASAVQLKHLPTGVVVKSQATRSRTQNRQIARRLLAEKLEEMEKGPEARTAIKAEIMRKKRASKGKKARRKYRRLQEGKDGESKADDEGDDEDGKDGDDGEDGEEDDGDEQHGKKVEYKRI